MGLLPVGALPYAYQPLLILCQRSQHQIRFPQPFGRMSAPLQPGHPRMLGAVRAYITASSITR